MGPMKGGAKVSNSPKCEKCGFVMCEQFDETPGPNGITYATPNGTFKCYHCGAEREPESND